MPVCRAALIGAVVLLSSCFAISDGVFLPEKEYPRLYSDLGIVSTEQKGIIIEVPGGREVLLLQTTYQGPASEFAWIIPVPGKPGEDDVFVASAEFIEHLLDTTAPHVETHIETPPALGEAEGVPYVSEGGEDRWLGGPGGPPPTVTVHRRMDVGDYDVSVLSATGPEVLIEWLNENGYATPTQHADVIDHYVRQGWYFVALRVRPTIIEQRPVLDDVKPIGIEFPTDELVYPLYISRASSRRKTALTLVALTAEPVECTGLHVVELPLKQKFERGTSYSAIRRETMERAAHRPAAIVEYAGYGGFTEVGLHWAEDCWPKKGSPKPVLMWTTRWWMILDLQEMNDLVLQPAEVEGSRVVVERHGRLPGSGPLGRLNIPVGPVAGGLFLLFALWGGFTGRVPPELARMSLVVGTVGLFAPYLHQALALLTLLGGALAVPAVLAAVIAPSDSEARPLPVAGWQVIAWVVLIAGWVWLVGVLGFISRQPSDNLYVPDGWLGSWALWLVPWVVLAVVVIGREWTQRHIEPLDFIVTTLVLSVPLWVIAHARAFAHEEFASPLVGGFGALLMVMLVGSTAWLTWPGAVHRIARASTGARIALLSGLVVSLTVMVLFVLSSRMMNKDLQTVVIRSLLAMAAAAPLAFAWIAIRGEPAARRPAAAFALALLIVGSAVSFGRFHFIAPAHGGYMVQHSTGLKQLDDALAQLDEALLSFLEDTSCYPASLADLTATTAPPYGLDSSGNRVPLASRFNGPYLKELPEDPLTGERDTWLYEVTGAPMIDTGGLTITLRRESTPQQEEVRRILRGRKPLGARYPFALPSAGFEAINENPEGAMTRLVTGAYGGELLLADLGADLAARLPLLKSRAGMPDAICLSPDGRRVAFAYNAPRTAYIGACDVFYTVHVEEESGNRWSMPGESYRNLLLRPWRAEVIDIAWHPTEDRWALLARPQTGSEDREFTPPPLKLYVLDEKSGPQAIAVLEEGKWVAWAADGRVLYVLANSNGSGPGKLTPVTMRCYSLDGVEIGTPLDTMLECFISNPHGTAYAIRDATAIEFIAPDGGHAILAAPEGGAFVESLWVGPEAVIAAWAPKQDDGVGLVTLYASASAEPRVIGRYASNTCRPIIIGRDADSDVVVITWGIDPARGRKFGTGAGVYALLPVAPFARRLLESDYLHKRHKCWWAGERVQVQFLGWVPPNAFALGDLLGWEARSSSVEAVAGIQGGDLIVGDRRIPIPTGLPIIGETEFLLHYRLVD